MGEDPARIRAEIEQTRAEMGDTVDALGYKTDVKGRARDKVVAVKDRASDAAGVAQENPLGLAVGSIAVGFLAGMLVPTTRVEDEKIGPMAEQVREQVKETGQEALEHGKEVAQQAASSAAETAKEAGREHGEQLKESAADRARETSVTG